MNTRKRILVAVAVLAVVALLAVASVLLVKGGKSLNDASVELGGKKMDYEGFFGKNPFPSRENVAVERESRGTLDLWFSKILSAVSRPPIAAERSPSTFVRLLAEKRDSMIEVARKSRMREIPDQETFTFSFDRYLGGSTLPAPDDVPELTQQLLMVDGFCRLLFQNGIQSLKAVTRDEFESAARTTRSGETAQEPARVIRGVGGGQSPRSASNNRIVPLAVHPLYTRMTFGFEFVATEEVLWKILNALASRDVFTVVTMVSLEKTGSDLRLMPLDAVQTGSAVGEDASAALPLKMLPRSQRQASGTEMQAPLDVQLELHAYLFKAE